MKPSGPRIVSVSRRTDIPAFYTDWFMNRVRAGFALVPNPFNPHQITTVGLRPGEVACFVFWTRDPRPLFPHLGELERLGYPFYFHVTLTGLPAFFEPRTPPADEAVAAIRELSQRLGPKRVIWRFDPLLLTDLAPAADIAATFDRLSDELAGSVERVVISFARFYRQVERRLALETARHGLDPKSFRSSPSGELPAGGARLLTELSSIASSKGLTLYSCAEKLDLTPYGIRPGRCIDAELIDELFGSAVNARKDRGQRPECGCSVSIDIGSYGTCRHGCLYCYAAVDRALGRGGRHDPESPFLIES